MNLLHELMSSELDLLVRAAHFVSPIHEGTRPGIYVPSRS